MKLPSSHVLHLALVTACLSAAAVGCKKKPEHTVLPLGAVALPQSAASTRLPPAGTLAFIEGSQLRIAGHFVDDCPPATDPPCTAQYRFTPTDVSIALPPAPIGDPTFLTSPDGKKAVSSRRGGLSKLIEDLEPIAAAEQTFRADAGSQPGTTLLAVLLPTTPAWIVYDLLYTGNRARFDAVHFVVQGPKGQAIISPSLPARPVGATVTNLLVTVDTNGIDLRTPSGHIGPGCEGSEPGTTLPDPKLDVAALTACATKALDAAPGLGQTVEIKTFANTKLQDLIRVQDALARKADGSPLFPDCRLHTPRGVGEPLAVATGGAPSPSAGTPPAASSSPAH